MHKQFAHPRSDRLIKLITDGGIENRDLFSMIREVEATCEICCKNKKPHLGHVVGFSLSKKFNDTASMDLKTFKGVQFLHETDNETRFSAAAIITSNLIFKHWIALLVHQIDFSEIMEESSTMNCIKKWQSYLILRFCQQPVNHHSLIELRKYTMQSLVTCWKKY